MSRVFWHVCAGGRLCLLLRRTSAIHYVAHQQIALFSMHRHSMISEPRFIRVNTRLFRMGLVYDYVCRYFSGLCPSRSREPAGAGIIRSSARVET
jgi:hypothetical protein